MDWLARLKKRLGRDNNGITGQHTVDIPTYVIGEERFFQTNIATSTGEYLLAQNSKLAYDTNSDTVRKLYRSGVRGSRPHSLVFEPSSLPFNYKTMEFEKDESSDDVIINDVMMEAFTYIREKKLSQDREDRTTRLQTALLVTAVVFGIVSLVMLKDYLVAGGA